MKKLLVVTICALIAIGSPPISTAQRLKRDGNLSQQSKARNANNGDAQRKQATGTQNGRNAAPPIQDKQQIQGERQILTRPVVVNLRELSRQKPLRPTEESGEENEPDEPLSIPHNLPIPEGVTRFTEKQSSAPLERAEPLAPSPAASSSFQASDSSSNGSIPPDTHGAVGPNHLMVVHNGRVRIQNRSGAVVIPDTTLNTFWSQSLTVSAVFDPKVLYDPYSNHWIFTSMSDRRSAISAVLIGVSQTSDPTGNWNLYRVDADLSDQLWADYPSLGFNKDWIVVSANMYTISDDTFTTSNIYVLNKASLIAGSSGSITRFNAQNLGGTITPAITYDNTLSTMYLLNDWNSSSVRLFTISGAVGSEVFTPGAVSTAAISWAFMPPGDNDFAPQLGSTQKIQNNDARMQNVVYRNGSLWATHTVFLPSTTPTRSAVQWWQLSTAGAIQQRALIQDATGNTFYAFPTIAVNKNNNVLIGYSRFSASQYASANYSFRAATDPVNTLQDDVVLKAGEASYYEPGSGTRNRWGDYSNTVVDPLNDTDMWTIQEYARAPMNEWGTWWGRIGDTPPPAGPPNDNFANAQIISGSSGTVTGTNVGATKETGEPIHADNSGGASVWYQWQAPGNGSVTITTAGSNFDTLLGVYTGSSVNALTPIASNDDDPSAIGVTSKVTFNTVSGTTYRIAVDGFNRATGNITLNWNWNSPAGCSYSISPSAQSFTSGGGTGSVSVAAGAGCTWTATSNISWITINSGSSGSGNGSVGYTVSANTSASSRSGTITVSGQNFTGTYTVSQTAPFNLIVASTNPGSGVSITVSPNDINGLSSGTTQFTRTYHNNTVVSLTAPATAGGNNFQKWQRGGVDYLSSQSVNVTMDAAYTLTAVYVIPSCPSVTGITPTSGVVGSSVTITGNNLSGVTAVKFSNNISAGFTVNSNTQITATVPNGAVTGPITISKTGCSDVQTSTFTVSPPIVQITVQTNPSGRSFSVDGNTYTTPQTFSWTSGTSHSISTILTQGGSAGTQYVWSSWSDGGALSHNVVAPASNATYTANFNTQYFLTMNAGAGGSVTPPNNWYGSGQSVSISATPNSGFNFSGWSGSGTGAYTGPNNPATIVMNGPITETASFTTIPLRLDSVSPVAGRTSGGQQVKLSGAFASLLKVMFGGIQSNWSYSNGTIEIIVTTPAHDVGAVAIDLVPSSGNIVTRVKAFAYLTTVFTDNQLFVGVTTAKAQHILELRRAVDALRAVAGLQAAQWTDPGLSPGAQIKAVHIRELRSYLEAAAIQLGYPPVQYTDPSLGAGSIIKRIHIEELRQRIRAIAG